jgi:outer membrane protein TolC
LHLAEVRTQAGLGNQFDVERQREQIEQTRALAPAFIDEIHRGVHALSVLAAQAPGALEEELEKEAAIPPTPRVPIGLPADLLERRPDLRQKWMRLASGVGAAKADLFPKILLTGAAGRRWIFRDLPWALGISFLRGPPSPCRFSRPGGFGPTSPLRKQQYQEAITRYQSAVLSALRETEDSLSVYGREQERRERLRAAVE